MKALLNKEMHLSASILTYLFLGFSLMTLLPGYPILCSAFFISFGIFHSFQTAREANDILYTALLPVAKRDVVRGKFQFAVLIELCGFLAMAALTLLRMTALSEAVSYRNNALMNANFFFLGAALVIFGLFNLVFIAGFFKTAYKFTPFVPFIIAAFLTVGLAETVHHIPGLEAFNAFGFTHLALQLGSLLCGALIYAVMTVAAYRISCRRFERIDL